MKALYEKHGKAIKNTFERFQTMYANSKGTITTMTYKLEENKGTKYAMRFYEKDMVWRVLNLTDQLKHPSKEYAKAVLDSKVGKEYREKLKTIWDPLFSKAKGGQIDFVKLFEQAKDVHIPEKALQLFQKFAENYEAITANCIEHPKVDTRKQSFDDGM